MSHLPWPLPALIAWLLAWGTYLGLRALGAPPVAAMWPAALIGGLLALPAATRWRRLFVAIGFPASLAASGAATLMPAWAWLLPLAALAGLYPARTWRDAPLFPTPEGALASLPSVVPLPAGAAVVDAGCGLGAGLRELHRAYPQAQLTGWEWSWPLRIACAWRCRFARVRRVDIWRADWSGFAMVYLFQRPETMPRAVAKARDELAAGSWLVSLEFPASELTPTRSLPGVNGKPVWLYRAPFKPARTTGR